MFCLRIHIKDGKLRLLNLPPLSNNMNKFKQLNFFLLMANVSECSSCLGDWFSVGNTTFEQFIYKENREVFIWLKVYMNHYSTSLLYTLVMTVFFKLLGESQLFRLTVYREDYKVVFFVK